MYHTCEWLSEWQGYLAIAKLSHDSTTEFSRLLPSRGDLPKFLVDAESYLTEKEATEMIIFIEDDVRTLSKWLNEEQTCPIDREALAKVLTYVQRDIDALSEWEPEIDFGGQP